MRAFIKNHKLSIYIFLLILISGFLRFYKLNWAQGLFTHPDEYHIASSVAQLSYPAQMHPNFFSYGTVTIYLIYFTQQIIQIINHSSLIINPFLIGRFYSALFSTLTIFIVYKICSAFFIKKQFSLIAAFLVAITPGLIQQAHFATPESGLTFFLFGSLLFMIKFVKKNSLLYLFFASLFLGFALGVKISSVVFLLPLVIMLAFSYLKDPFRLIGLLITSIFMILITFRIAAPYVFLDFPHFRGNFEYEGALAIGKIAVFYTRQFIDTIPVLFQIERILPYALGPVLLLFSILGLISVMLNLFQHLVHWGKIPKPASRGQQVWNVRKEILLILIAFLSLFLTNAFLFAKWTRFIAPTFPFFAIFAAFLLSKLYSKSKSLSKFLTIILLIGTGLWTMAFFSIYTNRDIRITASKWLVSNAPSQSVIVIEGGNMIDIPLEGNFTRLGFDFYNFEENQNTRAEIAIGLEKADYFLVQSRRVFMNHQRLPNIYPKTAQFYDALFDGKMGFKQIKTFYSYPKLSLSGITIEFPDEQAEETWSVFDHPVIRVFKKTKQLSKEDYAKFLEN